MALDQSVEYSPGQITKSTWDEASNAVRVNVVAASGGGDATAAKQDQQTALLTTIEANLSLNTVNTPLVNDYSSTNVTTAAYVQLIASVPADVKQIEIFDSSGSALYLAIGAAASEVNKMIVFPGGNSRVPMQIPAGSRLSIKALDVNATTGELLINFYA